MGLFDSLVKAGISAISALDNAVTKKNIDTWKSMKRMSNSQLLNVITQHGSNNSKTAIAIAALNYNGEDPTAIVVKLEELDGSAKENRDNVKQTIERISKKMSTESGQDAKELAMNLDKILETIRYR